MYDSGGYLAQVRPDALSRILLFGRSLYLSMASSDQFVVS